MAPNNQVESESSIKCKVLALLESKGFDRDTLKVNHEIPIATACLYKADIVIVDKDHVVKAVFETKRSESREAELATRLLYVATYCRFPCCVVALKDGMIKIAQVSAFESIEWKDLEPFIESLHERLVPKDGNELIDSVGSYFKEITRVQLHFDGHRCRDGSDNDTPTVRFVFRGEPASFNSSENGKTGLTPSLFRRYILNTDSKLDGMTLYREEECLIQEACRIFPEAFKDCKTDIDKLTVAQHFGIPTRLLDVTGNALVALYFAAQDSDVAEDGVVYVFKVTSKDYKLASTYGQSEKITIEECHKGGYKGLFDKPQLVFPTFRTQRQRVQDGAFYLFGNTVSPFKILMFSEQDYRKIIIPKYNKREILFQLKTRCNIHKGTLFPEVLSDSKDKIIGEAIARIAAERL